MYTQTQAQIDAERKLIAQGFKFSNWISAQNGNAEQGCMVFTKRGFTRYGKEYREIDPEGNIN